MDTRFLSTFSSMIHLIILLITIHKTLTLGFDSGIGGSCNQKMSRQGRAKFLKSIPCDLTKQSYCNLPGSSYPWHAVRKFVHDNQGLMKRMYGDIHHISVLRNEIQKNDLDFEEIDIKFFDDNNERNSEIENENSRISKYLHSVDFQNGKLSQYGISQPHFRPTSSINSKLNNNSNNNTPTKSSPVNFNESKKYNNLPENEKFIKKHHHVQKIEQQQTVSLTGALNKDTKTESNNDESNDVNEIDNQIEDSKDSERNSVLAMNNNNNSNNDNNNTSNNNDNNDSNKFTNINSNKNYEKTDENNSNSVQINIANNDRSHNSDKNGANETDDVENKSENNDTISATLNVVKHIIQTEMETENKVVDKINNEQIQSKQNVKENSTNLSTLLLEKYQLKVSSPNFMPETTTIRTTLLKPNETQNLQNHTFIDAKPTEKIDIKSKEKSSDYEVKTKIGNNKTQILEGQLFQDTIQKESPNLTNLRGVNACPTKEEVVAPFWANNTRGEVLALLNLYPFEQYVHWERCSNEHKQMYCREGCRCEQQYSLHRLLAYDPHDECRGIFSDWFRFPSCCICKCYNIPIEVRTTSRSPRSENDLYESKLRLIDKAEAEAHRAVYNHAIDDWYRPQDNLN
ncbi:protein spaetzle 4 [Condylostylus longicornis]|uniref:protein spaetzle 4 n=1 Tax=Condylostylus longicornis TaxID=2530218 RepID=UPI00244E0AE9|nr:protein spaetzle 4 [Condylostylus longicornis]